MSKFKDSFLFTEGFAASVIAIVFLVGFFSFFGYMIRASNTGMFQITFSDGRKLVCRYARPDSCGMTYEGCDDKMTHVCTVNSFYEEIR